MIGWCIKNELCTNCRTAVFSTEELVRICGAKLPSQIDQAGWHAFVKKGSNRSLKPFRPERHRHGPRG